MGLTHQTDEITPWVNVPWITHTSMDLFHSRNQRAHSTIPCTVRLFLQCLDMLGYGYKHTT